MDQCLSSRFLHVNNGAAFKHRYDGAENCMRERVKQSEKAIYMYIYTYKMCSQICGLDETLP